MKSYEAQFLRLKHSLDTQVQMYDLLDPKESEEGFSFLTFLHKTTDPSVNFYVFSAGGDGTFSVVISKTLELCTESPRVFFSILAFGTGNDLSQALLWERVINPKLTFRLSNLIHHVHKRLSNSQCIPMDIWNIEIHAEEGGYIQWKGTRMKNLKRLMCNYMTFGLQGYVGTGFEKRRHRSRTLNIAEYMRQALLRAILHRPKKICSYMEAIETSDGRYSLDAKEHRAVEMIIQNLPGIWGRQMMLWDTCPPDGFDHSDMTDGKLESFFLKSRYDYMTKQVRPLLPFTKLKRFAQDEGPFTIHFKPDQKVYMMIDGEFYILMNVHRLKISHVCKIPVLARENSKE